MKSSMQVEVETIRSIVAGFKQDAVELDRHWPEQKRGSKADRVLKRMLERVDTIGKCADDAISSVKDGEAPGE